MKALIRGVAGALGLCAAMTSQAALIDIGNGMVYDSSQNLTWAKAPILVGQSWSAAKATASASTLGGFTDWRLPSKGSCVLAGCTDGELGFMYYNYFGGQQGVPNSASSALFGSFDVTGSQGNDIFWLDEAFDADNSWNFVFQHGQFAFLSGTNSYGGSIGEYGVWLVREGDSRGNSTGGNRIPVPTPLMLSALGLLVLAGARRRT